MEKEKKRKKINLSKKQLAGIFAAVIAVMGCIMCFMGYSLIKITRVNHFSKNIRLNSNYFLNDYGDEDEEENQISDSIFPSGYQGGTIDFDEFFALDEIGAFSSEEDYSMETACDSFMSVLEEMVYTGYLSGIQLEKITEILDNEGLYEASEYANSVLGFMAFNFSSIYKNIDVPYISQAGVLPNGCEAVSAVMLLHYYNYNVDLVDFVDKYLDKGEIYIKWGCRYGPNPMEKYAGDPKDEKNGWGCFAPVIVKALNKYLDGGSMTAKNLTGQTLEEIIHTYISNDIPAAVWVTQNMEEIEEIYQWQSYDKSQTFLYPVHEHCMVLTGYDNNYYYFNDPLEGKDVKYKKSDVSYIFNSMGRQAAVLLKNA